MKEAKLTFNLEETDSKNIQDEGDWTFVSAQSIKRSLPLASEMPLNNRKKALWMKRGDNVSNDLDLGRDNHVELVQIVTQVKTSATIKR